MRATTSRIGSIMAARAAVAGMNAASRTLSAKNASRSAPDELPQRTISIRATRFARFVFTSIEARMNARMFSQITL